MTDKFTPEERSRIMSRVKGANTQPEKLVRSLLHRLGFRFRLHRKDLPGKPDIVLPRHRKVIFVHGCFWHGHEGCSRSARPTSNQEFWDKKLAGNIERDRRNFEKLENEGWQYLVLWQCELKDKSTLTKKIRAFMKGRTNGAKIQTSEPRRIK